MTLAPNPNEVCDTKWVSPDELKALMEQLDPTSFTPWFKLIVKKFLFPWWDVLSSKRTDAPISATAAKGQAEDDVTSLKGVLDAKQLRHLQDDTIHRML